MPNIGPHERRKRRNSGLVLLAVGLGLGVLLLVINVPWWLHLALFLPLSAGTTSIYQAVEKT